jgi:bidirectional [NiFe] hydrogenase diaphorase subunit
MNDVKIQIDGQSLRVPEGTTVLKAAKAAGIAIPTLCNDDGLEPYGACRMCMVEIEKGGRKKMVASCLYPAEEGLVVRTDTEKVRRIRRMIVELLWPAFQQYGRDCGITGSRFQTGMTDCSLCGLCVRYCAEVKKAGKLYFKGRGIDRAPAMIDTSPIACAGCRECYSLCSSGWVVNRC